MDGFIEITHTSTTLATLREFIENNDESLVVDMTAVEFAVVSKDGVTNIERIVNAHRKLYDAGRYTDAQWDAFFQSLSSDVASAKLVALDSGDPLGVSMFIPEDNAAKEIIVTASNQESRWKSFPDFFASALDRLVKSSGYRRSNRTAEGDAIVDVSRTSATIWVWCRALGSIIDLSRECIAIKTSATHNGVSFNFEIHPIRIVSGFEDRPIFNVRGRSAGVAVYSFKEPGGLGSEDAGDGVWNLLQQNDLVFIRLDELELEEDVSRKERESIEVSKSELPGKVYDVIGLIDSCQMSRSGSTASISVTVSGRDLTKLLLDDGIYFMPSELVGGLFANDFGVAGNKRIDGALWTRAQNIKKTIGFSMRYLINALAQIEICPDDLFSAYARARIDGEMRDARSRFYAESRTTQEDKGLISSQIELYEQRAAAIVAENRVVNSAQDGLTDIVVYYNIKEYFKYLYDAALFESPSTPNSYPTVKRHNYKGNIVAAGMMDPAQFEDGGSDEQSTAMKTLISGITGSPVGQSSTMPEFIVEQLAWGLSVSIKALFDAIYQVVANEDKLLNYKSPPEDQLMKGVWQIVKFEIDKSVDGMLVCDTSIGNEMGSLINGIRKWCQDPFVEFFCDTYGDQFYLIVRRYPFDEAGYLALVERAIDIDPAAIYSLDLATGGDMPAAWYKLTPKGFFDGLEDVSFAYVKAVRFPEFAKIWGDRALDIVTNYIQYTPTVGPDELNAISYIVRQVARDLRYIVQCNAYLPFARKGSISIRGDRRIKRGTVVRLKSTGEMAYVETVSHSIMLGDGQDFTTTLQLSHVLVEKHLSKYFNICDTPIDESAASSESNTSSLTRSWKTNVKMFEFFTTGGQFKDV